MILLAIALSTSPVLADPALSPEDEDVKAELGLAVDDLVRALPACQLTPGDGGIDLQAGCVDGLCLGSPVADAIAVLEASCEPTRDDRTDAVLCRTEDDLSFWDHREGTRRQTSTLHELYIHDAYAGRTASGLGPGASLACFLTELGTPDTVRIEREGERFVIAELRYATPRVWIRAKQGVATKISLHIPR